MLFENPYFQATDEGELVFLMSDGDGSRRPTEHEILEPEEEHSTLHQNYYLRIPLAHADSQRWRDEIAKYLAPLVLGGTYNLARSLARSPAPKRRRISLSLTGIFIYIYISAFLAFNLSPSLRSQIKTCPRSRSCCVHP
jgi:hypothetical protein